MSLHIVILIINVRKFLRVQQETFKMELGVNEEKTKYITAAKDAMIKCNYIPQKL